MIIPATWKVIDVALSVLLVLAMLVPQPALAQDLPS